MDFKVKPTAFLITAVGTAFYPAEDFSFTASAFLPKKPGEKIAPFCESELQ